jgi:hypothetical protein
VYQPEPRDKAEAHPSPHPDDGGDQNRMARYESEVVVHLRKGYFPLGLPAILRTSYFTPRYSFTFSAETPTFSTASLSLSSFTP